MKLFHAATMAALLTVGAAAAADPGRTLEPTDAFALEYASDAQISPDGTQILYVRNGSDIQTDERISSVWIIDAATGAQSQVSDDDRSGQAPHWSPDGGRYAYIMMADDAAHVRVHDARTGGRIADIELASPPRDLTWSPDGRWFAFAMFEPGEPYTLAEPLEAPEGAEWKEPAFVTNQLLFQLNGVGLVPPGSTHVFIVPSAGGEPRRITPDDFAYGDKLGGGGGIAWTPDSREVIVSANFGEDADRTPLDTDLYAYALDGDARRISDWNGPENQPQLSPDGSQLAYLGFEERSQGFQNTEIFVMPAGGGTPRSITAGLDRTIFDYRWAADGSGLWLSYDDRGVTKLGFVTLTGQVEDIYSGLGGGFGFTAYGGELGAGPFSVARNGSFGITVAGPHQPGDIAISSGRGAPVRQLTHLNQELLDEVSLGEVRSVEFPSSVDGGQVQGWMILPPDFDPHRHYPLILEIHGGPYASYGPRFDIEKQMMAAAGYIVLYINPRGSTSYGEAFGNAIQYAYPGDDYFDLMSGVDHLIEQGFVDPDRLYVTGGSGGGILTAWIVSQTDRFAAAAAHYPVIDWTTEVLTSDVSTYMLQYWFRQPPWESLDGYDSHSPLALVGRVNTPTLVLCGEEDHRTPISQAEMYYTALQLRGVDSALVRLPDEPHGASNHPSHQLAKVRNTIAWFDLHHGR